MVPHAGGRARHRAIDIGGPFDIPSHGAGRDQPVVAGSVGPTPVEPHLHPTLEVEPPILDDSDRPTSFRTPGEPVVPPPDQRMLRRIEGQISPTRQSQHVTFHRLDADHGSGRIAKRGVVVGRFDPVSRLQLPPRAEEQGIDPDRPIPCLEDRGHDGSVVTRPLERGRSGHTSLVDLDAIELVLEPRVARSVRRAGTSAKGAAPDPGNAASERLFRSKVTSLLVRRIDPEQTDPPRHPRSGGCVRPAEGDLSDRGILDRGHVALPDLQVADRGAARRQLVVRTEREPGLGRDRDRGSVLTADAIDVVPANPDVHVRIRPIGKRAELEPHLRSAVWPRRSRASDLSAAMKIAPCSFQSASSWTRPCCNSTAEYSRSGSNVIRLKSPFITVLPSRSATGSASLLDPQLTRTYPPVDG